MIASPAGSAGSPRAAAWPPVVRPGDTDRRVDEPYWDRARETMSEDERAHVVLAKIQALMAWAYERAPFYRTRWDAAGLQPGDVKSLDDFSRVPTITKADLRADQAANPPFGSYLCVDPSEIVRVHGTSGTSGRPTAFGWTRDDYERIAEAHARIMWSFGLRPSDTVFIGSIFSLYVGSWGALAGVERLGATAFPFGAGVPGMTLQAVSWMQQMKPTRILRYAVVRAAHRGDRARRRDRPAFARAAHHVLLGRARRGDPGDEEADRETRSARSASTAARWAR